MSSHVFVQVVSAFRIRYGERPFWLFIALLVLLMAAAALTRALRTGRSNRLATAAMWLGIVSIATYLTIAAWYALLPYFFDYAEPTVAAIAWLFEIGKPIYHAPDAAERYSHIYGPLAFMIPGWFLAGFGT